MPNRDSFIWQDPRPDTSAKECMKNCVESEDDQDRVDGGRQGPDAADDRTARRNAAEIEVGRNDPCMREESRCNCDSLISCWRVGSAPRRWSSPASARAPSNGAEAGVRPQHGQLPDLPRDQGRRRVRQCRSAAARHEGRASRTARSWSAIISDETKRNPQTVMPPFGRNLILTDQEIEAIVDFLYTR